jgi:hypothetical protein
MSQQVAADFLRITRETALSKQWPEIRNYLGRLIVAAQLKPWDPTIDSAIEILQRIDQSAEMALLVCSEEAASSRPLPDPAPDLSCIPGLVASVEQKISRLAHILKGLDQSTLAVQHSVPRGELTPLEALMDLATTMAEAVGQFGGMVEHVECGEQLPSKPLRPN